jgi:hypothetical protein
MLHIVQVVTTVSMLRSSMGIASAEPSMRLSGIDVRRDVARAICRSFAEGSIPNPAVDLMVISPTGKQFSIDVKGVYKPIFSLQSPEHCETVCSMYSLTFLLASQTSFLS